MKTPLLSNFSDPELAEKLVRAIHFWAQKLPETTLMEVCGTHTMEIGTLGIRSLLPGSLRLVSGPGCPVCITPAAFIDMALTLVGSHHDLTLYSYGDMFRVRGKSGSLEEAKSKGATIEMVLTPLSIIEKAKAEPHVEHVFVSVGFETTIPALCRALQMVINENLQNVSFLVSHRLVMPALEALCADSDVAVQGFLLPGHVSAIIGTRAYHDLPRKNIASAVCGFEPIDILFAIVKILEQLATKKYRVDNCYNRIVRDNGNEIALNLIDSIFDVADGFWRGIAKIPNSALILKEKYARFDARKKFCLKEEDHLENLPDECHCGSVLKGIITPDECPMFGTGCVPAHPVGPCMISSEGSCAAYYKFSGL